MGTILIGAITFGGVVNWILTAIQVLAGLGLVIFVHELGHFLVAKWCGVKCLKFYVGFDFFGWKLAHFQYGETEYGIGVFPLGGYVKMLGQEDDPRAQAEAEKADAEKAALSEAKSDTKEKEDAAPEKVKDEGQPKYHPRDYRAKNVPQRMAIISAGVIMNVIFAFLVTIVAALYGFHAVECEVSNVVPGSPAWFAGMEVGDTIKKIGTRENPLFRDLKREVMLADTSSDGIPLLLSRPGISDPLERTILPTKVPGQGLIIGVSPSQTNTLSERMPTDPNLPASKDPAIFEPGDEVIKVGDQEISNYPEMARALAENPKGNLVITVKRGDETIPVDVQENPLKSLGLVMAIGKIVGTQQGSLAEQAGFKEGDLLSQFNGEPIGDPLTLPHRVYAKTGEEVTFTVQREGKSIDLKVTPNSNPPLLHAPLWSTVPLDIPSLGLAYLVLNRVQAVDEEILKNAIPKDSEETVEKLKALLVDKQIQWVKVVLPEDAKGKDLTFEFGENKGYWPHFALHILQHVDPDSEILIKVKDAKPITLKIAESKEYGYPDRGLVTQTKLEIHKEKDLQAATDFALLRTWQSMTEIFLVIPKMISQEIGVNNMGGPIKIVEIAGGQANLGFGDFLMFLAMISANLAVINFLPIPVLDGGHMVFLLYEGVRGKPAHEQVWLYLHLLGFAFILSLIVFVFYLDISSSYERWYEYLFMLFMYLTM